MSERRRTGSWGILGGTFDPIHDGHLALAQSAREELDLDGVVFVPAGLPPHKTDRIVTAPSHRVAMVELAIADEPAFVLSRVEVARMNCVFQLPHGIVSSAATEGMSWVYFQSLR